MEIGKKLGGVEGWIKKCYLQMGNSINNYLEKQNITTMKDEILHGKDFIDSNRMI